MWEFLRRRRQPDLADLPQEPGEAPLEEDLDEESAELAERPRRSRTPLIALGLLGLGLIAFLWSWSGRRPALGPPPRLLHQVQPPGAAESPASLPAPNRPQPSAAPTFYQELPASGRAEPRSAEPPSASAGSAYQALADKQQRVQLAEYQARLAELDLKAARAQAEADEIRKNPKVVLRGLGGPVPPVAPPLPLQPPPPLVSSQPQPLAPRGPAGTPAVPMAPLPPPPPPAMRVRMVTLDPRREALIETSGAWFTVRPGEQFPQFRVLSVDPSGVVIDTGMQRYFYPVGGTALGARLPEAKPLPPGASTP